jgi:hypothetical protein
MRLACLALVTVAACDGPVVVGQSAALATCCLADGVYTFTWTMAASIPAQPDLSPSGVKQADWLYHLDTDPTTAPPGLPLPHNQTLEAEFGVVATGDASGLSAALYDRRPLLLGQPWIITPIDFTVVGAQIIATVPSALLGDPPRFAFSERTADWTGPYGSSGAHLVDFTVPRWVPFR